MILAGWYIGIDWGAASGVLTVAASFVFAVTSMGLMLSGVVAFPCSFQPWLLVLTCTSMLGGCMAFGDINNKVLLLAELTPPNNSRYGKHSIKRNGF